MKTQKIRRIINARLKALCGAVYYQVADTLAPSLYIVYDIESLYLDDMDRDDIRLIVDVWGLRSDTAAVDDLIDEIDKTFNGLNCPEYDIYPTIYRQDRRHLPDEDKNVYRGQIKFEIQTYEKE